MILIYDILIILVIIMIVLDSNHVEAANTKRTKQQDKLWKTKRKTCESITCAHLHIDESVNCVNQCTSDVCYKEVYGEEPLEDGEIDLGRHKKFMSCVRKEAKEIHRQHNSKQKAMRNKASAASEAKQDT